MRLELTFVAGALFFFCASGEEAPRDAKLDLTDSEMWNKGVELYRAGDVTNALATLKPLMLSRTHGARASELVSAIAYDRKDLEEAAAAAQIALRAAPEDARLNRNYTRATDRLPELREARHIEEVMKRFGQQQPDAAPPSKTCSPSWPRRRACLRTPRQSPSLRRRRLPHARRT